MKLSELQPLVDADAAVEFFDASVGKFVESLKGESTTAIVKAATTVCESSQVGHILAAPSGVHGERLCRVFNRAAKRFFRAADDADVVLSVRQRKTLNVYVSNVQTRVRSLAMKRNMRLESKHRNSDIFSSRGLKEAYASLCEHASPRVAKTK